MKNKFLLFLIIFFSLLLIASGQYKSQVDAEQNNSLIAKVVDTYTIHFPSRVTSVQAKTIQKGFIYWGASIQNDGADSVTNATISENSGFAPSIFDSINAFPVTVTDPILAPGLDNFYGVALPPIDAGDEHSVPVKYSTPASFSLGYNSSRKVSPKRIPVGGTKQTVTITLSMQDSRLLQPNGTPFHLELYSDNVPGVTLDSVINPTNLNQGETISNGADTHNLQYWDLNGVTHLNKEYVFKVVLNVPNPYGKPFAFSPKVRIGGGWDTAPVVSTPSSTVTVKDPTLDGPVKGKGAVTFSVAETNHFWTTQFQIGRELLYEGTSAPKDKHSH